MRASKPEQGAKGDILLVKVSDHGDRNALRKNGIQMDEFKPQILPSDAGYVAPLDRMNPEYLQAAKAEAKERQEKMISSMGATRQFEVVNPSPNMQSKIKYVF